MIETRYPNRWFGSNPQAISNQGKRLSDFNPAVPKDWRSALGLAPAQGSPTTLSAPEAPAE